ncbi:hypothetical protein chiPu_0024133, partial [Chiloscyllium punctatum]|nr:hypothetical protein [Chiloscyllium punctatum]
MTESLPGRGLCSGRWAEGRVRALRDSGGGRRRSVCGSVASPWQEAGSSSSATGLEPCGKMRGKRGFPVKDP